MNNLKQRKLTAISAIEQLRIGIEREHKPTILEAYDLVEDENFSWNGLDVIFMEWDDLVSEANDIIYS